MDNESLFNLASSWNWAFDLNVTELDEYFILFVLCLYRPVCQTHAWLNCSNYLNFKCCYLRVSLFKVIFFSKQYTHFNLSSVWYETEHWWCQLTLTFILHRLLLGIEIAENIVLCDLDRIDQSVHGGDRNSLSRWSCQSCFSAILISTDVFYERKSDTSTSLPRCYHQITNSNFGSYHRLPLNSQLQYANTNTNLHT